MSEEEKYDGILLNMATQMEGGVPEVISSPGKKYRSYSLEDLTSAYKLVKEKNFPVQKAADKYGIPESTLRDRVKGKIPLTIQRSGPAPVLGKKEEEKLVEYLNLMSSFGYGYSRTDIINIATEYAVLLGKREPTDSFTHQWYYNFLKRWPNLEIKRALSSKKHFEKAMSIDSLSRYFFHLQNLMTKYSLMEKADSVFMIDEILIDLEKSPPVTYSWRNNMKWEKSKKGFDPTMTLIASGNASGARLPAFFIFPGKTVSSESIEDCSPGTGATCSDDGTTNCNVFQLYLENHFLKFIERTDNTEPILLLYDGHRTHLSPALIEMYKSQNFHLFPIPPSISQMLMTINRGIFGNFESNFNEECDEFIETEIEKSLHSNICVVASKAYNSSVISDVLKNLFQRAGVYPFKPQQVNKKIDLTGPVARGNGKTLVKKEKMISVTAESSSSTKTRSQSVRRKPVRYSDAENFEELESELFQKKRKKSSPRKKTNYSNRRKSAVAVAKKKAKASEAKHSVSGSSAKPSLKLKFVRDTGRRTATKRKRKAVDDDSDEDSSEEYESDSDSEIDEMLSSEDDIDDQVSQDYGSAQRTVEYTSSERRHFESALREELLSTHGLYFEGTQREKFEREFEKAKAEYEKVEEEKLMAEAKPVSVDQLIIPETGIRVMPETGASGIGNFDIKTEKMTYTEEATVSGENVETGPTVIVESVEEEIPQSEKCCVCKQYHPDKMDDGYVVEFATWGKCEFDRCEHWTHLKYCCNVKVLRRHDIFYCPCHNQV